MTVLVYWLRPLLLQLLFSLLMLLSQEILLIPLIIKYPNCPSKTIDVQVGAIDIFYTILDLLRIEYNNKFSGEYLGKSLVPLINGKNEN